jgi:hypothetical protein
LVVGGVAAIAVVVGGCALITPSAEPQFPQISRPVISVSGRGVEVSGDTDLPDGARMDLTAVQGCTSTPCNKQTASAVVSRGRYTANFGLTDWPAGTHYLWVEFHPDRDQSAAVREKYGADGSKMSGPRVRPRADDSGWEWFGVWDFTLG